MFSDNIRRRLQYFLPFYTAEFTTNMNCVNVVKNINQVTVTTIDPHGLGSLQPNDYFHIVNIGSAWNILEAKILVNKEPYLQINTTTANFIKTGTALIKVNLINLLIRNNNGDIVHNLSGKYSVDVNITGSNLILRNSNILSNSVYHDILANGYVLDYSVAQVVLNNPPRITDKTFNRVIKKDDINIVDATSFTYEVDEQEALPYIFNDLTQIRKAARIYTSAVTAQELFNNNNNSIYHEADTNQKGSSIFIIYTGLRSISNPKDLYGQNARSDFYLQQLIATYNVLLCVRTHLEKEDHKRYANTLSYVSKSLVPYIIKDLHGQSFLYEDDWLKHSGTLGLQDHTILSTSKQTLLPYLIEFNCQQRIDGTALTEDGPGLVATDIDFYIKNNFSLDNENIISGNVGIDSI